MRPLVRLLKGEKPIFKCFKNSSTLYSYSDRLTNALAQQSLAPIFDDYVKGPEQLDSYYGTVTDLITFICDNRDDYTYVEPFDVWHAIITNAIAKWCERCGEIDFNKYHISVLIHDSMYGNSEFELACIERQKLHCGITIPTSQPPVDRIINQADYLAEHSTPENLASLLNASVYLDRGFSYNELCHQSMFTIGSIVLKSDADIVKLINNCHHNLLCQACNFKQLARDKIYAGTEIGKLLSRTDIDIYSAKYWSLGDINPRTCDIWFAANYIGSLTLRELAQRLVDNGYYKPDSISLFTPRFSTPIDSCLALKIYNDEYDEYDEHLDPINRDTMTEDTAITPDNNLEHVIETTSGKADLSFNDLVNHCYLTLLDVASKSPKRRLDDCVRNSFRAYLNRLNNDGRILIVIFRYDVPNAGDQTLREIAEKLVTSDQYNLCSADNAIKFSTIDIVDNELMTLGGAHQLFNIDVKISE